ncbi:MAG: hypothetical protein HYR55_11085 [Acidobacteria bacterium]|nr:hypothetical protein [Acidobacteriota bacterium]MBI3657722.1 hypothetical protein [Acidobacteriota bacterium]
MIAEYRQDFNRRFTEAKYRRAVQRTAERVGRAIPFRIAESPIFIPTELLSEMISASHAIIDQLSRNAAYWVEAERIIPGAYRIPHEDAHPLFLLFDYAVALDNEGRITPMLTELQGFPSLLAFQYFLSQDFQALYALNPALRFLCEGLDDQAFIRLFRQAVLNGHDPENVALVDVTPWEQGTLPDFLLTRSLCPGLNIACPTELRKRGRKLYYTGQGKEIPIHRIFHRVIWEELTAHEPAMNFRYNEELEVEWAGHPNWFFKYSKFSLPYLKHRNVPKSYFLDQVNPLPYDLDNYILKPLFSFSGRGLELDLTEPMIARIPAAERSAFVLQEKIHFAPAIAALDGAVHCEIRLMYVWLDQPVCVMTLPRMSRGRLMGCAYNKTDPWTGHGLAFFPDEATRA